MERVIPKKSGSSRDWKLPLMGTMNLLYYIWKQALILMLTICFTGIFFSTRNPYKSTKGSFRCNAEGNVEKQEESGVYNFLWDPNQYFTINITFGKLSFTSVKIIDACWDSVVGRGGQVLVGVLAYRVVRRSFALAMETCELKIGTVTSVYLDQIQLTSVWRLISASLSIRYPQQSERTTTSLYARLRLVMQASACLYVLAFATFVSIMTGYRTELEGVFDYGHSAGDGDQVKPIANLSRPRMIVHDGDRIGLAEGPIYFGEELEYPPSESNTAQTFRLGILQNEMSRLGEPYGPLVECTLSCSTGYRYRFLTTS
jgi:hypothetical protein